MEWVLLNWTEFILASSMSSLALSWIVSCSTNFAACCTHLSIHWALSQEVGAATTSTGLFHGSSGLCSPLAVFLSKYFATLILSNLFSSVIVLITADWAICASTLLALVRTFLLVMVTFPFAFVNSLIISPSISMSFNP